jgi:VanZ family protein
MLRSNRVFALALLWAYIIFATSCSFIERSVFINFVKRFIPAGMPQDLWVTFWQVFGLLVVKGYHVTEYAVLCWLLQRVLHPRIVRQHRRALVIAAFMALIYAASDEWHQTFVPGRGGTWVDVVIDSFGISLATLFSLRKLRQPPSKTRPEI